MSKFRHRLGLLQTVFFSYSVCVMVNFMHQLGWDGRYTDIWSNIILGVSVTECLDDINI